tara:strand:- start:72 stop:782 length:711 start_codon:yes stop_codon:yes gene_type:complete
MYFKLIRLIISLFDLTNKKKVIKFFKSKFSKKINTLVDVGAHHGETINQFLKNFEIDNIYAFEPSKENYQNLIKKTKHIKNLKIFNLALGSQKGIVDFKEHYESQSSTITKIDLNSDYYKRKNFFLDLFGTRKKKLVNIKVKIDRLDSIQDIKNIDILKIDTEGYDFNVIKGMGESINKVKSIYFEHHFHNMLIKNYTLSVIHNYLIKHNFKKKLKIKMKFRKTFEYIYINQKFNI